MNFTFTPWQGGKEFWHNHTDHSGGDEGKVVGKLRPVLHGTTNPDIARKARDTLQEILADFLQDPPDYPAAFHVVVCVGIHGGRLVKWMLRPKIQILERDSSRDPARLTPIGWLRWRHAGSRG